MISQLLAFILSTTNPSGESIKAYRYTEPLKEKKEVKTNLIYNKAILPKTWYDVSKKLNETLSLTKPGLTNTPYYTKK